MEYKQKILKEIKETQLKKVPLYTHYLEKVLNNRGYFVILILVFDGGKRVFGEWIQEDFREDGEDYVLRWEVYCYENDCYKHRYPEMKQKYNILKSIQPTDFNQLVRFFSFLTVTED